MEKSEPIFVNVLKSILVTRDSDIGQEPTNRRAMMAYKQEGHDGLQKPFFRPIIWQQTKESYI